MTRPSKTLRRLTSVALAAGLLLGSVLLLVGAGQWHAHRRSERQRVAGMDAFHRADYPAAMDNLAPYLRRHDDNAEAWLAYARSRQAVEEPDGSHLVRAIKVYERYVRMVPTDRPTAISLVTLYNRTGRYAAAADAASRLRPDRIEEAGPDLAPALHEEAVALLAMRAFDGRLGRVASRLIDLRPSDLPSHLLLCAWLVGAGRSPDALSHAQEARRAHPDDPRFALLDLLVRTSGPQPPATDVLPDLCVLVGLDLATAQQVRAATYPDAFFAQRVVELFESLGRPVHASAARREAAAQLGDRALVRTLAH